MEFNYDIRDRSLHAGEYGLFQTIDELKSIIKDGSDYYNKPYELFIFRDSQDVNIDTNQKPEMFKPKKPGREEVNLFVTDKLTFPDDVVENLRQNYGEDIVSEFKSLSLSNVKPVCFFGIKMRKAWKYSRHSGKPLTSYVHPEFDYHRISGDDIVVDTNLNQIWPTKTNQPPIVLMEFLANAQIQKG